MSAAPKRHAQRNHRQACALVNAAREISRRERLYVRTRVSGLLTEKEAAEFLRISPRTLQKYRQRRQGPAFVRLLRSVRYRQEDLEVWTQLRTTDFTDDEGLGTN